MKQLMFAAASAGVVFASLAAKGVVLKDISGDVSRQTVIAEGGRTLPEGYQGHPTTVLTHEGKLICVWTFGHGGPCGPAAESTDGGRTWTRIDARLPAVYRETHKNCPTLQKCVRKDGGERLFVFSAKFKGDPSAPTNFCRLATMISDDGGRSWREGRVADVSSAMPPTGFMTLKDGSLALFGQVRLDAAVKTDRPQDDQGVWMSVSRDDGETWGPMRIVAEAKERNLCEPCCLRSPDGKTLALVMRENRHRDCSMMCFSSDEGQTWTKPVLTAPELSGDRHEALALEGGRYLICFRDRMVGAPTYGQYVGWVGGWDDLVHAKPGEMRIRLLNHHGKKGVWPGNEIDTGYSGIERLPDGTILCTTYTRHFPDDRHSSVVATRLYPSDGVLRGKEMCFKKVFAFSDIGDDAFAAKLAELNVFAAGCGGKPGSKEHAERLARAKRFGIVPYVSNCGPGAKAPHRQTLSPEEAYRQCELAGEFLPEDLKGAARGEALNALWRKQHYRWGGEPENGNSEVYFEGMGGCFVGPKARAAGVAELVRSLKAEPEAKAVCLDYIGYGNYHGCYHPHCLHLLKTWLGEKGLADTEANRDRFFEDELVAYYNALYDAVKAQDASVVVYAHLYPVFKPNPLFGNRLKLDYCGQTCAWYSRWPAEKVKRYAETVVRGQRDHWPFAHAAPFIAYGPWAGEIDPDFRKTPEDVERELRTFLEAGAEYLAVHEIKSVIDDPAVFAVFKKYCGKLSKPVPSGDNDD